MVAIHCCSGLMVRELLTRGNTPYSGINNYYMKDFLTQGRRTKKPTACPPVMWVENAVS